MIEEIRVSIIIIKNSNVNMFILCDLRGYLPKGVVVGGKFMGNGLCIFEFGFRIYVKKTCFLALEQICVFHAYFSHYKR